MNMETSLNAAILAGYKSGARLMLDDMKEIVNLWRKDADMKSSLAAAYRGNETKGISLTAEANTLEKCAALLEAAIRSAEIRSGRD